MESHTSSLEEEELKRYIEKKLKSIYPPPNTRRIKSASRVPTKSVPECAQRITLHAQTVGGTNENIVSAKDGRTKVEKPAKWPNSVHGVVSFKFNGAVHWGTGTMIGPNVVLTAGHNLYSHKYKAYAENPQFLPGMNGCVLPFGLIEVEQYYVSPRYIKDEKEDYGILILKEPIGEETGYFGLACLAPEEIKSKQINVTGYPGDKVASQPNIYEMWGMEGEASHIDESQNYIHYLIDTGTGQSGSGVWYQEEENYYVCGVHVSGTHFVNTATLLTRTMYQQIHMWLQKAHLKESFFEMKTSKDLSLQLVMEMNVKCISVLMKYRLDGLTKLTLNKTKIGNEEIQELAKNTSWIQLTELDLSFNAIDSEGARALAENISWKNLSWLNLSNNNIGPEGASALAQNTSWTNLLGLDLSSNNIGSGGAQGLAQNTSWEKLFSLDLSKNNIGLGGLTELAGNASWKTLSQLYLSDNNIGCLSGVLRLAHSHSRKKLFSLDLSKNNISFERVMQYKSITEWENLFSLNVSDTLISCEVAKALKQETSWKNKNLILY